MSKIDLKNPFRLIPVRLEDRNLLDVCWCNHAILCRHLSTTWPQVCSLINMIHIAILHHSYCVQCLLHYLDNFFMARPANSSQCSEKLQSMFTLCRDINAPIKLSKVEGSTTSLIFLGTYLNSKTMEASISNERKHAFITG